MDRHTHDSTNEHTVYGMVQPTPMVVAAARAGGGGRGRCGRERGRGVPDYMTSSTDSVQVPDFLSHVRVRQLRRCRELLRRAQARGARRRLVSSLTRGSLMPGWASRWTRFGGTLHRVLRESEGGRRPVARKAPRIPDGPVKWPGRRSVARQIRSEASAPITTLRHERSGRRPRRAWPCASGHRLGG